MVAPIISTSENVPVILHHNGGVTICAPGTNLSGTRVDDQVAANLLWIAVYGQSYPYGK